VQEDPPAFVLGGASARNDSAKRPERSGTSRAADEFDVQGKHEMRLWGGWLWLHRCAETCRRYEDTKID